MKKLISESARWIYDEDEEKKIKNQKISDLNGLYPELDTGTDIELERKE